MDEKRQVHPPFHWRRLELLQIVLLEIMKTNEHTSKFSRKLRADSFDAHFPLRYRIIDDLHNEQKAGLHPFTKASDSGGLDLNKCGNPT